LALVQGDPALLVEEGHEPMISRGGG
jgi:hypothetical protein